jgi:hypothetical protein
MCVWSQQGVKEFLLLAIVNMGKNFVAIIIIIIFFTENLPHYLSTQSMYSKSGRYNIEVL